MPKTKFENIVFTLFMSFLMVYAMFFTTSHLIWVECLIKFFVSLS